ncbi:MAG: YhgE/Pip domain-containing protein [Eubacterium sp.]|nr:YhgE/Pip domain-containing protein [Eubacterium sp.]
MKNIFKIFNRDLKSIFTNSMAIILAVGLAVIPSLYAWFNIFANWDPYGSTGNMQVAVVIEDEGYKYRDIEINVGQEIKTNLEANDLIDWQFVSKQEATKGIEAGKYYAGIEIPSGFSKSLTSIVSDDFKQPSITYYANEKKNAIATKITDKVVQTVQQEVNESFVTTVINVVSSLINVMADATESGVVDTFGDLQEKLATASETVNTVQKSVDSFGNILTLSQTLGEALSDDDLKAVLEKSNKLIDSGTDMTTLLQSSINGITSYVDVALNDVTGGLSEASKEIGKISSVSDKAQKPIAEATEKLLKVKAQLEAIRETLETVKEFLPSDLPAMNTLISRLDDRIARADRILALLSKASDGSTKAEINNIISKINSLSDDITTVSSDYKTKVKPVIDENLSSLIDLLAVTGDLVSNLNGDLPALEAAADTVGASVKSGEELISTIDTLLSNIKKQIDSLSKKLEGLGDSEIVNTVKNLSGKHTDELGAFLACPVTVKTDKVYGIENYGSAMAPFYSTLAIWVGAMVLIAVVKTKIKKKKEIGNVRIYQSYFGRMLTFLSFSVTQALIICLGDLYFLKIQCYHPFKFILAGVVAAVAFTVFVYSLGFTFGDIGKSIGIIFLVIQIGGSGGTFPIDVTPNFFRVLNPYMPFTFVINAMRECVCGTYANDYWIDLLKLSTYIGVGLIIGLGVKFLVKKPIRFFEKSVEKTGLF